MNASTNLNVEKRRKKIREPMGTTRVKGLEEEKKEKKKEKKKEVKPKKEVKAKTIVRIANTDLDGEKKVVNALLNIKGLGHTMSRAVCIAAGIDPDRKLMSLSEEEIKKLEDVIKNPRAFGIPSWLLNRRFDPETGKDLHLVGQELVIKQKFDIQRMIDMKCYRGLRHMYGLPVRGQRTRSTHRKGMTVGVVRKKEGKSGKK